MFESMRNSIVRQR